MTKNDDLESIYADRDRWVARADNARQRIDRAKRTLDSCTKHLGVGTLTERVRDLVAPYFPRHRLEVFGPFGIANETAIHAVEADGLSVAGVRLRPRSHGPDHRLLRLHLVDHSRRTDEYPEGSLGSANGLNFPEGDEPATVHDIVAELDNQIAQHERSTLEQTHEGAVK